MHIVGTNSIHELTLTLSVSFATTSSLSSNLLILWFLDPLWDWVLRIVSSSLEVSQTGYSGWACQSAFDSNRLYYPLPDLQCYNYSKTDGVGECDAWPGKFVDQQWDDRCGSLVTPRRQLPGSVWFSLGHYWENCFSSVAEVVDGDW